MRLWNRYKNTSLIVKMTVGFALGLLVGVIVGPSAEVLKPLGTILINLLSMIATPVVFLTVVLAVNKMNPKELGRTGGKLILSKLGEKTPIFKECYGLSPISKWGMNRLWARDGTSPS